MTQSEITEERCKIRECLDEAGLVRISYTYDEEMTGEYQEVWTGTLGIITIQWFSDLVK